MLAGAAVIEELDQAVLHQVTLPTGLYKCSCNVAADFSK